MLKELSILKSDGFKKLAVLAQILSFFKGDLNRKFLLIQINGTVE